MKAILSIFLMLEVLFSSMSITVNMHYCLGELADIAFLEEAEVCSFEKYFGTSTPKDGLAFKNKSCCGSESYVIHGQNHETTLKSETKTADFAIAIRDLPHLLENIRESLILTPNHLNSVLIESSIFLRIQSFRL
ncbi:HYC_CC_PP family protein [Acidiluteibacter ferrifornacis]|uniref:Uncharacterized protein n=1 Tax=Acidiluteibacter ferrifornacis TaxID=2692424 RepID=A0A6N9NKK5_9FLAO|nr:hypothetical protein [Acidiluteibacter ferrifornacis]NBG66453.1 hypothetical protein [Acidiluteibacter ferrifornacis]